MSEQSYYAKQHYDGEEAERYDEKRLTKPKWEKEQAIVHRFLKTLPKGAKVLDCPVGTGRFLAFYKELGLTAAGADVSPGMIEEAKGVAQALGAEVDFEVADAESLPFEDKAFGALVSHRFIKWLPSDEVIVKVLREFARVTDGPMLVQIKQLPDEGVLSRLFGRGRKRADKGRRFTAGEIQGLFAQAGMKAERFDDFVSGKTREVYYLCRKA